jgi:hypothetical protein
MLLSGWKIIVPEKQVLEQGGEGREPEGTYVAADAC